MSFTAGEGANRHQRENGHLGVRILNSQAKSKHCELCVWTSEVTEHFCCILADSCLVMTQGVD